MTQQPPKAEFTNVDAAAHPEYLVQCLDDQRAARFNQMYKQHTFTLLDIQPGHSVLDAGCGTGQDALEMAWLVGATGHVVGIDFSQTMIDEANKRSQGMSLPASFRQGDVHRLESKDNTFDRCRADKTFQHLPEPRQALAELIRVTKPNGKLLIVEPDHETVVIDTPYKDVTRRFLSFRSDSLQQGGISHQLYGLFKEYGLKDVAVEPLCNVSLDYETINRVMHFDGGIRIAAEYGAVTPEEADRWIASVEEAARSGRFFHAITYFITTGYKPG